MPVICWIRYSDRLTGEYMFSGLSFINTIVLDFGWSLFFFEAKIPIRVYMDLNKINLSQDFNQP